MDRKWSGTQNLELYLTLEPRDLLTETQELFFAASLVKDLSNILRSIFEECLLQLLLLFRGVHIKKSQCFTFYPLNYESRFWQQLPSVMFIFKKQIKYFS